MSPLLQACLNGGRAGSFHPAVPLTPEALAIIAVLDRAAIRLPRLLHGLDATMWPMYRLALRLGLETRIGLEDGDRLPSGERAASNAALIAAARALPPD
ncbi:MAG: 3-keto-5-aminohexanoate cleavage protein [Alphaproteobacteria bacterium]|nr:3-keto-5-aminohexanoate cleavage protein [Alphaproteobacteria bacterium]